MKTISETVKKGRVLVSDGAWGTELHKLGLKPGECPELWCLQRRDAVLRLARSYVEAGADMVQTNSFGANRFKLDHFGLAPRAADINRAAAAISREAAGPDRHVIASMGPTGKFLLSGDVTEEELYEAFAEQAAALEQGGADACCIESFFALDEAVIAIRAARERTRLEILCTFTFEHTAQGTYRTIMGVAPADLAAELPKTGAQVIGTNCGNGMKQMADIVREIRAAAPDVPILVHANAGKPTIVNGGTVFPESPEEMAVHAREVVRAGANIVGGCCGTTPEHIRAIARAVRGTDASRKSTP